MENIIKCEIMLYDETGIIANNIDEFQSSAFYPYTSIDRRTALVSLGYDTFSSYNVYSKCDRNRIEYFGVVIYHGKMFLFQHDIVNRQSQEVETKKMIETYSKGVKVMNELIERCHKIFSYEEFAPDASRRYITSVKFGAINILSHINHNNIPKNENEIDIYKEWLLSLGCVNHLKDSWGRSIIFSCSNKMFSCISAGADGEYNTADDIKTSVRN